MKLLERQFALRYFHEAENVATQIWFMRWKYW